MERIGENGGLARTAIEAALERQAAALARIRGEAPAPADKTNFAQALFDGVRELDRAVSGTDELPLDILRGDVQDLHEIAARVKQADLSLKFAFQVRNKLIDAYREVMRMSV
jgi:flagellar hook-basal body complex protein FliE